MDFGAHCGQDEARMPKEHRAELVPAPTPGQSCAVEVSVLGACGRSAVAGAGAGANPDWARVRGPCPDLDAKWTIHNDCITGQVREALESPQWQAH